jgi:hypothetical protein
VANAASFHGTEHHSSQQRRRSTRIAQTLPLIVRGMDLLGQPFEERTTTMVFNVHGCKYPSKHHLPKNTWVTLEAPQRESSTGPECVRARVVWIQRPHTVRELFQIAVELETPANIWGLASPPGDWNQRSTAAPHTNPEEAERVSAILTTQLQEGIPATETAENPPALTNFMETLLSATKKRVEESGEQPASLKDSAIAGEAEGPLLRELRAQVERHAVQAVEHAAAKAKEEIEQRAEKIQQERTESAETFYQRWKEEFERASAAERTQLSAELEERIASTQEEVRSGLKTELETNLTKARDFVSELDRRLEALRSELDTVESSTGRLAQMRLQIDAMSAALEERARRQAEHSVEETQAGNVPDEWRQRLTAEMELARGQWNELLQSSLDSGMQRLLSRVAEGSQSALESAEQQMKERLAELSQPALQALAEARESLAQLRGALDQELAGARASLEGVEETASRLRENAAQFEAASQDTLNQLHRRLEKILSTQTAELNRRADALAMGLAQRVAPVLESAGQQFIARTMSEVQSKIGSHLERVPELLRELSAREVQAEESLRLHRERLRQSADNIRRESDSQQELTLAQLRNDLEAARKEALSKWVEELDASGVNATHAAAESIAKASEWHVQQAQARMHGLVENSLVAAGETLEKKVREVSQEVAADLERQRSAHAEQLQVQLEGAAGDVIDRSRSQIGQAAQAAAVSFGEVLGEISEQAAERFRESSRVASQESAAQLEHSAEQLHRNLEVAAGVSLESFRAQLSAQVQQNLGDIEEMLRAECGAALDSFRSQREAVQQEWRAGLDALSGESIERYQERLQTASDSWMMGSVRKLNEHGQNVIESLTRSSEQALRSSFARVFDGLGQMMRDSLRSSSGAASSSAAAGIPTGDLASGETEKHTQN